MPFPSWPTPRNPGRSGVEGESTLRPTITQFARHARPRMLVANLLAVALAVAAFPAGTGVVRAAGVNSLALRATYDVVASFNWETGTSR